MELFERGSVPPDADGLAGLVRRLGDAELVAVFESMNGARFVHDRLELAGWEVRIADALKAKVLAPLACKTDTIDAWALAELARRDLVPEIWLPDPARGVHKSDRADIAERTVPNLPRGHNAPRPLQPRNQSLDTINLSVFGVIRVMRQH